MGLYEELLGIIDAFNEAEINYAVCGGIAVAFHGYARFTRDIDVLILEENIEEVLEILRSREFVFSGGILPFDVGGPCERRICRISKIEGQELLTLDLVFVTPFLQEVWDEREVFEWKGRKVQIVSAEGLATMKRLAGRDQDLLDLKKLGFNDDQEPGNSQS